MMKMIQHLRVTQYLLRLEEELARKRCMWLLTSMFYYIGFWPSNQSDRTVSIRNVIPIGSMIMVGISLCSFVLIPIYTSLLSKDPLLLSEAVYCYIVYATYFTYVITFYFRKDSMRCLVSSLYAMETSNHMQNMFEKSVRRKYKMYTNVIYCFYWCCFVFIWVVLVPVLIWNGIRLREPLHIIWMPFDMTATVNFIPTLIVQVILSSIYVCVLGLCFVFVMLFPTHIHVELVVLNNNIRHIRDRAASNLIAKRRSPQDFKSIVNTRMTKVQSDARESVRMNNRSQKLGCFGFCSQTYPRMESEEHTALNNQPNDMHSSTLDDAKELFRMENKSENIKRYGSEIIDQTRMYPIFKLEKYAVSDEKMNEIETSELDVEMEILLREYVRHHQAIIRLLSDGKAVLYYVLISELLCFLIGCSIITLFATFNNEITLKSCMIMISCCSGAVLVFISCFLSERLSTQGELICFNAYACSWLDATPSFKQSMRIIMTASNGVPLKLTAGGRFPFSYEMFAKILHSGFGYYKKMANVVK